MDLNKKFDYCALYCEENSWKLCQEPDFLNKPAFVVFASNANKTCAIWHQKAAESDIDPVVFDYHVFLLIQDEEQGWLVFDLDSTLGFPVNAETYFRDSFSADYFVPEDYRPLFRLLTPQQYIHHFSSDRSHMKDENGQWLQPPPVWEAPFKPELGMNLFRFVQMEDDFIGEVLDLQIMGERVC